MPRHPKYNTLLLRKQYRIQNAHNASAKLARERLIENPLRAFRTLGRGARAGSDGHLDTGDEPLERTGCGALWRWPTISKKNFQSLMRSR